MPDPAAPDTAAGASAEAERVAPDPALAAAFAEGLGDRRQSPRFPAEIPCTVLTGRHVHDGVLRNVSAGGAMLRNVPGLVADDLVQLRLSQHPGFAFHARVRAISLIGAHLEVEGAADRANWTALVVGDAA